MNMYEYVAGGFVTIVLIPDGAPAPSEFSNPDHLRTRYPHVFDASAATTWSAFPRAKKLAASLGATQCSYYTRRVSRDWWTGASQSYTGDPGRWRLRDTFSVRGPAFGED